jgi:hypothetical protein
MKKIYLLVSAMIFVFGCSTTPQSKDKALVGAPDKSGIKQEELTNTGNRDTAYKDNKKRLEQAIIARDRYMQLMRDARTVEEADRAKEGLDRAQETVEYLQLELEETPQVKFEHKTPIYGPLGWVLIITEFTLKRLYILFEL